MKKLNYSIIILLAIFSLTACKKNGETNNADLTISFQNQVNGANFGLNVPYRNASNVDIQYEIFQFYLSDIMIVNANDEARLVSEIELFKFDATGFSSIDFRVPLGDYKSISFGIGVKKELNEADPSTYSEEGNPLNITENTYWGWASMYRFIMSEGRYDGDLDGTYEGTFAYHTGREASYRTYSVSHDFEVNKKGSNTLAFTINLYELIDHLENEVDVLTEPYYHGGTENEDISTRISDNMVGAIQVAN